MKISNTSFLIFSFLALFVSGCASIGKVQSECEQVNTKFADIYSCTKAKIDRSKKELNPRVKLYLLSGERLVQELEQGKITEVNAKIEWQKLYLELQRNQNSDDNEAAARAAAAAKLARDIAPKATNKNNYPTTTNCYRNGDNVSCHSY